MSQEEIYREEEHYQDWKSENLDLLKDEFLGIKLDEPDFSDEFEAYCKQQFKDRD